MKNPCLRGIALSGLAAFVAASLAAAPKADLDRITPVPADQPIPIQDFFRPTLMREPRLNPAGTHLAAVITQGVDQYSLLIYDIAKKKAETLAAIGDKDITHYNWLTDQRLMYSLSSLKYYDLGLFAVEVGHANASYPLLQYTSAQVISIPLEKPDFPVIWMRYDALEARGDAGPALINTNVHAGTYVNLVGASANASDLALVRETNTRHVAKTLPALKTKGFTTGYLADKVGNLAYGFSARDGLSALHYLDGEEWHKSPIDLEAYDIVGAANQPDELVVLGPAKDNKPRPVMLMKARTGEPGETILQDKAYDFSGYLYRDPATRDIVGAMYTRAAPQSVWFTEEYRTLQKILDGFFPGVAVRLLGSNRQQSVFLVVTFSDRQPGMYYTVDLEKRTVGLVKNSAPWIDPKRMRPMSVVKVKTRDGRQLDAYVTMPEGASKTNPPPLIVLPHGGPWARDTWGYNPETQFLASRGYAVVQVNYRGSTGYGWMFPEEDEWDFRKMHEDVTDTTKMLVSSGLVDRNRVAIMGGSFGGYLAISGVVNEPDLYRCAVTMAGVFDWGDIVKEQKYYQYSSAWYDRLIRKLGDPKVAKDKFERISPINGVQAIKVPVFVAHGKDDTVVNISQSRRLIAKLKEFNVAHEVFFAGGEGHGMAHLTNEIELHEKIEAFLDKNLMKAAPPPAVAVK